VKVDRLTLGETEAGRRLAARVRPPGGDEFELWFTVPRPFGGDDLDATPFLVALMPWALAAGQPFDLDGAVSPRVLAAVDDIQRVYCSFYPDELRRIEVRAASQAVPPPGPELTTCFFSRGLDSWYSVLAERESPSCDPPLTHLVRVKGIDVNYDERQTALEQQAVEEAAAVAGLELVTCSTNLRRHTDAALDWNPCHGAGLAGIALWLRPRRSLTPSGYALGELMPAGSRFDLDYRFSTEHTAIAVHAEVTRAEKAAGLARWPEALALLNVCFSGNLRGNCSECSKCVHTMLELHVVGVDPRAAGFDRPVTPALVASTSFHPAGLQRYRETLARLRGLPGSDALIEAFTLAIQRGHAHALAEELAADDRKEPARAAAELSAMLDHRALAPRPTSLNGLIGLVRGVHLASGRHVYGFGSEPDGAAVAGELGALEAFRQEDSIPVWAINGMLTTQPRPAAQPRPSLARRARFVIAPFVWRDGHRAPTRLATVARRAGMLGRRASASPARAYEGEPVPLGYLHPEPGEDRCPLYAATHGVTGDQLLTTSPLEADDMGYERAQLLGYLVEHAPVRGRLGITERPLVPWASRLGRSARM
jgi:hypothetical protein